MLIRGNRGEKKRGKSPLSLSYINIVYPRTPRTDTTLHVQRHPFTYRNIAAPSQGNISCKALRLIFLHTSDKLSFLFLPNLTNLIMCPFLTYAPRFRWRYGFYYKCVFVIQFNKTTSNSTENLNVLLTLLRI